MTFGVTPNLRPRFRPGATLPLLLLTLLIALPCVGCSEDDEETFVLVWSDEFDGPEGTPPDSSRWRHDVGGSGWGNQQLEFDTDRTENVRLDGAGHLAIIAREEAFGGRDYTSGRINTRELFDQAYGRFEARIRLPRGRGIWPAFWLLGSDFNFVGWPACGEIDVMEYRGQEPWKVLGSLHGPSYSGGNSISADFELPRANFDDDFHVFAVEWTDSRITWFVDDTAYHRVRPRDLPGGADWVFDHPFFLILNVAVGGNFVGSPDETTVFPQTMLVDWVRVYGTS